MDAAAFRQLIGNFATGVTVVTTCNDGFLHGVTANSLASVSLDPLLLLVCIDKSAHGHAEMLRCSSFGVNILAADQRDVSSLFAKVGEPLEGRLRGDTGFCFGQSGCPLIDGAIAQVECVPHHQVDAGDHTVFIGRVLRGQILRPDAEPLVFFRGAYRALA